MGLHVDTNYDILYRGRSPMDIIEQVKSWLEKGEEEAKEISELPWDVEYINNDPKKGLVAVNPKMPLKLYIIDNSEMNTLRLVIPTGILTADLEPEAKLRTYRSLLSLNKAPISKIYIDGMDGEVVVAADLSTKSLSEGEFHDTVSFVINTVIAIYNKFGLPANVKSEMLENLVWLIQRRIQKGWSKDRLEDFLVKKVGMQKQDADQLLDSLFPSKTEEHSGRDTVYM